MADFASLVISVNTAGLKKGEQALDATTRAGRKTEKSVDDLGKKSKISAAKMASGMRKAARAASVTKNSLDRLKASLDPVFAGTLKYNAALKTTQASVLSGAITQAEANKVLAMASAQYIVTSKSALTMSASIRRAAITSIAALGGITTAFFALRSVGSASQIYAGIGNNLRAIGVDAADVAINIQKIGEIAQRTRSPLAATAQLYQRVSIAGRDLNASQADVLRFTENVGLALAQQGGGAAQASGALLQLSQAMAGGTVRAEEFNSILEGAFPIAQAAANAIEGAAGSVGQLRNMVIAGEVSSKEFFDAILSSSDALEDAFANTVPTVSQAMTVLGTSFSLVVGEIDATVGASAGLAGVIIVLSENLDLLAVSIGVLSVTMLPALASSAIVAAGAMTALAVATNLIPYVAVATAVTLLFRAYRDLGDTTGVTAAVTDTLAGSVESLNAVLLTYSSDRSEPARIAAIESAKAMEADAAATLANVSAKLALVRANGQNNRLFMESANQPGGILFDLGLQVAEAERQLENARRTIQGLTVAAGETNDEASRLPSILLDAANEADNLRAISGTISFDTAITSVGFLALDLGVALDVAEKLSAALNRNAGIVRPGPSAGGSRGLTFGLPSTGTIVSGSNLGFGDTDSNQTNLPGYRSPADIAAALSGVGGGSGRGSSRAISDITRETKALADEIERLEFDANPLKKYNAELANLDMLLANGLSPDAYKKAVDDLNKSLEETSPIVDSVAKAFGDFVVNGFKDFQGFTRSIVDSFKSMLSEMIATAARNKIMIAVGMGGGIAGSAAQANGIAGSVAGSMGGMFLKGATNAIGAFSGGVMAGFESIATAASMATGSMGTLAAAAGAIALPIAAAVAVFSLFRASTKTLDEGIKITTNGMDSLIESFEKIQTSRVFGLFKSVNTSFDDMGAAADPLRETIGQMQASIMDAAATFGFGAGAFAGFSHEFTLSLKGLDEAAQQSAIAEELTNLGNAFVDMTGAFSTTQELVAAATENYALTNRLLEAQGKSTELLTRQRNAEMDATHALNQPLLARINLLADEAVATEAANAAMQGAVDAALAPIDGLLEASRSAASVARNSANEFFRLADSLREASGNIGGVTTAADLASEGQKFAQMFAKAVSGDVDALNSLGGAGQSLATDSAGFATSATELKRMEAGIRGQLQQGAATAEVMGLGADYQALTYDLQTAALEITKDMLLSGEMTVALMRQQIDLLGNIGVLIKEGSNLQGQTLSITELVERAASGNETLSAQLLSAIDNDIGVVGISDVTSGLGALDGLLRMQLVGQQELIMATRGQNTVAIAKKLTAGIAGSGDIGNYFTNRFSKFLPSFASGGSHTGGMRIVGENGPELEFTGPSQILNANQTKAAISGNSQGNSDAGVRSDLADLRRVMVEVVKYVKRTADIERKHDIDGTPAVRT